MKSFQNLNILICLSFFIQNKSTKVECAGLCLSLKTCHVFQWIGSNDENNPNECKILEKDGLCPTDDDSLIEIYVDANEESLSCGICYS